MSDDQNQDARTRALNAEMQANRRRMLVGLAEDWTAVAERLTGVYQQMAQVILDRLARPLDGDDPALLLERLGEVQGDMQALAQALANSDDVFLTGARAGANVGASNLRAGGMRVAWGEVAREQILAGINLVDEQAWGAMVGRFAPYHVEQLRAIVLDAVSRGKNPRETAELMRAYFEGDKPLNDALRIARTSQLYAARRGTQLVYIDNNVGSWMWSANLGSPRTCLACIAMHGTIHPSTEMLNDHFNGRCAPLPITPRWRDLGIEAEDNPMVTGVGWFERQAPIEQQRMMGAGLYEFWQAGLFTFSPQAVVGENRHPVFGEMRHRKPNWEIIGVDSPARAREALRQARGRVVF